MDVLFITLGTEAFFSSRTRVYQYLPHLSRLGVTTQVIPIEPDWARRLDYYRYRFSGFNRRVYNRLHYLFDYHILRWVIARRIDEAIQQASRHDLVFLQRRILTPVQSGALRQAARKLVYDFDDAIHLEFPAPVNEQIRMCDLTIAANEQLAQHARTINPHVAVIPTPIDTDRYAPAQAGARGKTEPVTIGWIGSQLNTKYLEAIAEPLRRVSATYGNRVQMTYVGADPAAEPLRGATFHHWSLSTELQHLRSFDIGIMPLPLEDPWAVGKAGYKLLQYMAMGIPCVASPVGVNSRIIEHGRNGFLARNDDEWYRCLSRLIESAELRQEMGAEGRQDAEQHYSHRRLVHDLVAALEDALRR